MCVSYRSILSISKWFNFSLGNLYKPCVDMRLNTPSALLGQLTELGGICRITVKTGYAPGLEKQKVPDQFADCAESMFVSSTFLCQGMHFNFMGGRATQ